MEKILNDKIIFHEAVRSLGKNVDVPLKKIRDNVIKVRVITLKTLFPFNGCKEHRGRWEGQLEMVFGGI